MCTHHDTDETPHLEQLLTQHGSRVGLQSFEGLCGMGCDHNELGGLFVLVSSPSEITLESGITISLRPLDSRETVAGGLDQRDLQRIADKAAELRDDCGRLRQTALVQQLIHDRAILEGDLLRGSLVPDIEDSRFAGLLMLPDVVRQYGARARPEYTRLMTSIFDHINERTGDFHDALVADILNDLTPERDNPHSEESLRQWRFRQRQETGAEAVSSPMT